MFEGTTYKDWIKFNLNVNKEGLNIGDIYNSLFTAIDNVMNQTPVQWTKIIGSMTTTWFLDNDSYHDLCRVVIERFIHIREGMDKRESVSVFITRIRPAYKTITDYLKKDKSVIDNTMVTLKNIDERYETLVSELMKTRDLIDLENMNQVKMKAVPVVKKILEQSLSSGKRIERVMENNPSWCSIDKEINISPERVREYGKEFFPNMMEQIAENGRKASKQRLLIMKREYRKISNLIDSGVSDIKLLELFPHLVKDGKPNIDSGILRDFGDYERHTVKNLREWANTRATRFKPCTKNMFLSESWIYNGEEVSKELKEASIEYCKKNKLPPCLYMYRLVARSILDKE